MTNLKRRLKFLQSLSSSLTKLHSARPTNLELDRKRRTVRRKNTNCSRTQTSALGVHYRALTLIYIPPSSGGVVLALGLQLSAPGFDSRVEGTPRSIGPSPHGNSARYLKCKKQWTVHHHPFTPKTYCV